MNKLNETIYSCEESDKITQDSKFNSELEIRAELFEILQRSNFKIEDFPGYDLQNENYKTFDFEQFESNPAIKPAEQTNLRTKLFRYMSFRVINSTLIAAFQANDLDVLDPLTANLKNQVYIFQ